MVDVVGSQLVHIIVYSDSDVVSQIYSPLNDASSSK